MFSCWTHQYGSFSDMRVKARDFGCLGTTKTESGVWKSRVYIYACFYLLIQKQPQPGGVRQELTRQDSTRCGVFIFQLGFLHYTNASCIIVCWNTYRKQTSPCLWALCSCQCKYGQEDQCKVLVVFSGAHWPPGRKINMPGKCDAKHKVPVYADNRMFYFIN